jgi:hypothetical protein
LAFGSWVQRQLGVSRWSGGWSCRSSLPVAAPVVAGGSASRISGARGVSPADGWMCSASFSSSTTTSVYCSSSKLHCDGVPADLGLEANVLDVRRRCRRRRNLASKGSRGFFVIVLFYKGLCASSLVVQLSSIFYQNVHVSVLVFVQYLYG